MKRIEAIIHPYKLEEVKNALASMGVGAMTVITVTGFGRQKGHKEVYRGSEYSVDFVPKIKIEIALPDALVQETVSTILKHSRTGKIGDGKIFVVPLDDAIMIRTGERGDRALLTSSS